MSIPIECESTTERIISVPISVIDHLTNKFVKDATAQIKVGEGDSDQSLRLVVACEEGIFSQSYSDSELKQNKTKSDLDESTWMSIVASLFQTNIYSSQNPTSEYSKVVLHGKLYSLDEYDPGSGQLLKTELADVPPLFELYIKTEGVLSVVLGVIPVRNEEPNESSTDEADMLSWILILTSQVESLRRTHFLMKDKFVSITEIADLREREIKEITEDYQRILDDLQDRFFQILDAKKKKIRELEGDDSSNLKLLNFEYVERSKLNLNHVRIEDIQIGENSKQYSERRKRRKVELAKKSKTRNTACTTGGGKSVKKDKTEVSKEKAYSSNTERDEGEIKVKLENEELQDQELDTDYGSDADDNSREQTTKLEESSDEKLYDSEDNVENHEDGESTEYSE